MIPQHLDWDVIFADHVIYTIQIHGHKNNKNDELKSNQFFLVCTHTWLALYNIHKTNNDYNIQPTSTTI